MFPEWESKRLFLEDQETAMISDSHVSTHPISVEVRSPDEANQQFDSISYSKV